MKFKKFKLLKLLSITCSLGFVIATPIITSSCSNNTNNSTNDNNNNKPQDYVKPVIKSNIAFNGGYSSISTNGGGKSDIEKI